MVRTRPFLRYDVYIDNILKSCNGRNHLGYCYYSDLSKTQEFRSIPVEYKLLKYIKSIGIGIPERTSRKQRSRRKSSKLIQSRDEEDAFFEDLKRHNQQGSKDKSINKKTAPNIPLPFNGGFYHSRTIRDDKKDWSIWTRPVKVIASVKDMEEEHFPDNNDIIPEVALAGRSNVGKSTLLNALLYDEVKSNSRGRRKDSPKAPKGIKANTSPKPGETTAVTFYQLSSKVKKVKTEETAHMKLYLVDLPGYGFAYDSKSFIWRDTLEYYLLNRGKSLKRVMLLLDARHGMKKADIDFLTSWENNLYNNNNSDNLDARDAKKKKPKLPPLQLVLTKCDLVSQKDLARRVRQVENQFSDCLRREPSRLPVLLCSVKPEQRGIIELQREIAAVIPEPKFEKMHSAADRKPSK